MNPTPDLTGATLLVPGEGMGSGPADLRLRLFSTFLTLLLENGWKPLAVAFYTDGVKLLAADTPALEPLRELEASGVRLIACKTCLDYFGIGADLRVGIVGGMADIQAAMALGSKVITL